MAKTDAERMKEYRNRKRNAVTDENVTVVTPSVTNTMTVTESPAQHIIGPLDVYSESRWAFLQGRGHKWDAGRQRGTRKAEGGMVVGVTVPGDPAYQGVAV